MRATLWGTRGSMGRAGAGTVRYGGDTACVEVVGSDGTVLILDAGSGLVNVAARLDPSLPRVDLLLTHLHMDHIQGLGFFHQLRSAEMEIHIWGPVSNSSPLGERLRRYLSPPLFPVRLRDLNARLHEVGRDEFRIGGFRIVTDLICHPGATVGFRLEENGSSLTYMPDHEPALGNPNFPDEPRWTSGCSLAAGSDVLIHDAQYTEEEYAWRAGWGHSTLEQAATFAQMAEVGRLVTFHHDPEHNDDLLDELHERLFATGRSLEITAGTAGSTIEL